MLSPPPWNGLGGRKSDQGAGPECPAGPGEVVWKRAARRPGSARTRSRGMRRGGRFRMFAMQLQVFGQSDVGKVRTHNEDAFRIDAELGLYVVCDGMGGHAAGEVASQTAAGELTRYIESQ